MGPVSQYSGYVIKHVCGESNALPDMLMGWMKGYRNSNSKICTEKKSTPYSVLRLSPFNNGFEWPDQDTITKGQQDSAIGKDF